MVVDFVGGRISSFVVSFKIVVVVGGSIFLQNTEPQIVHFPKSLHITWQILENISLNIKFWCNVSYNKAEISQKFWEGILTSKNKVEPNNIHTFVNQINTTIKQCLEEWKMLFTSMKNGFI